MSPFDALADFCKEQGHDDMAKMAEDAKGLMTRLLATIRAARDTAVMRELLSNPMFLEMMRNFDSYLPDDVTGDAWGAWGAYRGGGEADPALPGPADVPAR